MFINFVGLRDKLVETKMKHLPFIFTLLIASVVSGCSGGAVSNSAPNTNASNAVATGNINGVQGPVNVDANEVNDPSPNGNEPAAGDVASAQRALADRSHITVTNPTNPDGSKGTAKPVTRPAPDNSQYWSTLTDVAREFREFKDHPQIKKVEKTTDAKTSVVRIYLTNGKSVDVSGSTFPDISRVSVNEFVVAAGLQPIAPKTRPATPSENDPGKKRSEKILPGVQQ